MSTSAMFNKCIIQSVTQENYLEEENLSSPNSALWNKEKPIMLIVLLVKLSSIILISVSKV